MTDPVDILLREAGAQWRDDQPPAPLPNPDGWVRRQVTRRLVPIVAAASVIAVAGSAMFFLTRGSAEHENSPAVMGTPDTVTEPETDPVKLIVHDGDTVEASGTVEVRPGKPVRFCASLADAYIALPPGKKPECLHGVPVTGLNLDNLTDPKLDGDIRTGKAWIRGIWQSGTLKATVQGPPVVTQSPPPAARPLPCTAPPGGWPAVQDDVPMGPGDLENYVSNLHPDQFARPWMSYPYGGPPDGRTENWNNVPVLVVEVVKGDVNEARRELQTRYHGNLCVVENPGKTSIAQLKQIQAHFDQDLEPLIQDQSNGILTMSIKGEVPYARIMILTPELFDKIGHTGMTLEPWLRPVGK
jgi:hypothetical protein